MSAPTVSAVHSLLLYAIHSVLFHRGVYTREEFDIANKYGQTQYILADFQTSNYIETFLAQVDVWIDKSDMTHLVLVILAKDDGRTLERWTFDISDSTVLLHSPDTKAITKSDNTITDVAVPNVLKQIVAATTMLPDLPTPAVFTLQAYVANQEDEDDEVDLSGLIGEWKDATEEPYPFADVEVQQTMLRGLKSGGRQVDLLLTSLDD